MRFIFSLALIAALLTSCTSAIDNDEEARRLLETDKAFSKLSTEQGAAKAFYQYLDADAIQLVARGEPVNGLDQIYQRMSQDTVSTLVWEPQQAVVAKSGDLGYTWGFYTYVSKDEQGESFVKSGKYLNIWRKHADGEWRVLVDIGN